MADTVTTTELFSGQRRSVHHFTGRSDGTGETTVQKVDISSLSGPDGSAPSAVTVEAVEWVIQGYASIDLLWDHTSDVQITVLSGSGEYDWTSAGGKHDSGSGGSGDVLLTSNGASAGDTYDITLWLKHEA